MSELWSVAGLVRLLAWSDQWQVSLIGTDRFSGQAKHMLMNSTCVVHDVIPGCHIFTRARLYLQYDNQLVRTVLHQEW